MSDCAGFLTARDRRRSALACCTKTNTLQHAGVLFGWRGGSHDGLYESSLGRVLPAAGMSAARSGPSPELFLATRRGVFLAHQGFDELNLAVAYSDLDYALKLRASGLKILWTRKSRCTIMNRRRADSIIWMQKNVPVKPRSAR